MTNSCARRMIKQVIVLPGKFIPVFICAALFQFFWVDTIAAQCPTNLGFESGDFSPWVCSAGTIDSVGVIHVTATGPLDNRHVMLTNTYPQAKDPYGMFPVNCPNGSNYSIRLGNDGTGSQADRITYTFTVPPGQDTYSILYNYAVVFQNPEHADYQQPRFTAKVFDASANAYITCSSFDFAASSNLPGFKQSTVNSISSIFYKPWSPVTITLVGYGGKTLSIEFTVNDCTRGGHFGYAYLDVNEECSNLIGGNVVCAGFNSTTLVAPFGFATYNWFTGDFSRKLGEGNTLTLNPVLANNQQIALQIFPYPGSGCVDTLYTTMKYSATNLIFKVADSLAVCAPSTVDLTTKGVIVAESSPGLKYAYYLDSTQTNYVPTPKTVDETGTYFIKATNAEGCIDIKKVEIAIGEVPKVTIVDPKPVYYPTKVDITDPSLIQGNTTGLTYSYWRNDSATVSLTDPQAIDVTGIYYIKASTSLGCSITGPVRANIMVPRPPNSFTPNGDGINDYWSMPALSAYPTCTVDIFDRAGRKLFHSVGYNVPWNGKFNGKDLPIGTYYYIVRYPDNPEPVAGSVTILR